MVPLKYLSNVWRTLRMSLINGEVDSIVTWSANCLVSHADVNQATTFATFDTKLYVAIVTLSTNDNGRLYDNCNN